MSDRYDSGPSPRFLAFLTDDIMVGLRYLADVRLWLALIRDWGWWWPSFVLLAIIVAIPIAFVTGLLGGLTSGEVPERVRPNEGFRRSLQRALVVGVIFKLVGVVVATLLNGQLATLLLSPTGFLMALATLGWMYALVGGLAYGGYACWSHLALRTVLWRDGVMPLGYINFLEYATDRVFMRRVGSGYAFVHRLVQEHIAANERELVDRVCGLTSGGRASAR
jgi:hypothetical protein